MEVLNDILGYKNRKIYQDDNYFSFSLDSVMLANFVNIRLRDKNILDLGCGNGVIPLILSLKTNKHIDAIDIQEKLCNLAKKSIILNKLEEQISIINTDMKDYVNKNTIGKYDVITCNPPYFKVNDKNFFNESKEKMIARHEVSITLEEMIEVASKLLDNSGNFFLVHRTDRFMEIIELLRKYKLEPKRVRFVHENINKTSTLVLIESQKCGKTGLVIDKPFIMYNNNEKTKEYDEFIKEVNKDESEEL